MRIKPYIILGLAAACASAAAATIVTVSDPYTIRPVVIALFWAALFLAFWGLVAAILTISRQRLAPALMIGLAWAAAGVSFLMASRQGYQSMRLSALIIIATMLITFVIWIRWKQSKQ